MNKLFSFWALRYRLIAPLAALFERFLRPSWHRGKRAAASLQRAGISLPMPQRQFERAYYTSLWQSFRLLQFVATAPVGLLRRFLAQRVRPLGVTTLEDLANSPGPLLIASPHYGAFIVCCVAIIQAMHGKKKVHVLYNDPQNTPTNADYGPMFQRLGCDVELLFVGRKGTIAALKALRRNECVLIMPDVVMDANQAIAIPFMQRLLRVMAGTGFFALKGGARIAPIYCLPQPDFSVTLQIGNLVDARQYAGDDDAQSIFAITRALFADFERQYQLAPQHWNYWDRFAQQSRPLPVADLHSSAEVHTALARKLTASPKLAAAVPELAAYLQAA